MPLPKLDEIAEMFQAFDADMRLDLLLDYANRLPALPAELEDAKVAGLNRVPECMTPVFLFMGQEDGRVKMHVGVGEESPTVAGLMSIIVHGCDGEPAEHVAQLPNDLLPRLGLDKRISSQRVQGFGGIVHRIKKQAAGMAEAAS